VALGEIPGAVTVAGMLLIIAGVYLTLVPGGRVRDDDAGRGAGPGAAKAAGVGWSGSLPGLGTAACWAISPLLIRQGLKALPSPLLGVTLGMFGATVPQGLVVLVRSRRGLSRPVAWEATTLKLTAAVLVGFSTWTRWIALDLAPVAVVLALGLLSVPTVMLLAPPLAGRNEEPVTPRILLGAALVVAGSLLLVLRS
jgi:drug/metabolite transporter (DMT)-like permease